jgi:hypothetical protein
MPSRFEASEMLPPAASTARRMVSTSTSSRVPMAAGAAVSAAFAASAPALRPKQRSQSSRKSSDRCSRVIVASPAAITAAVRSTLESCRRLPGQ